MLLFCCLSLLRSDFIVGYLEKRRIIDFELQSKWAHVDSEDLGSIFVNELTKTEIVCNDNKKYSIKPSEYPPLNQDSLDAAYNLCHSLTKRSFHDVETPRNIFGSVSDPLDSEIIEVSSDDFEISSDGEGEDAFVTISKKIEEEFRFSCPAFECHVFLNDKKQSEVRTVTYDSSDYSTDRWSYKSTSSITVLGFNLSENHENLCEVVTPYLNESPLLMKALGLIKEKIVD
jgi:hypothetical protein